MDQAIDNLVISVSASADSAARSLSSLSNAIKPMASNARSAAGGMDDLGKSTEKVDSTIQRAGRDASITGNKVKRAGNDMKDSGKSAEKGSHGIDKYWAALKRVAFYRGVRAVIRSITDAFKTGITNMYQWSKVMDGTFAKSMDRIATSTLYLKNSLGAMMAPIINTLAPIIDYVVDGLVWIINHVNMLFAALSGSSTYTAAKKVATTWGDASKDVASNTKKAADDIKRTILGFDEINKLEKQNANIGSGGGGLSGSSNNFASMFEQRPVNSTVKNIADVIRNTLGPVFDFVGDHLDTILKVVGLVGSALLALKIGSKFSTGLNNVLTTIGKIKGALASVATAALTIALTYQFTNKYLETGSYAYLVGNAITTALGGAITGLTMSRAFGAKAGFYSAAATIGISGLVDMVLGINNVDAKGLNKENITTLMLSVVKGAIAGALIAKGAGFSLIGGLTAGALTMGISIGLVATLKLVKFKPEIELTQEQKSILDEIQAGNFDNAMKLSGNDASEYNKVLAITDSNQHKSKSLWNKIEEIMGWVAYADDITYPNRSKAAQIYASKKPKSNKDVLRFDPTIVMSDAAKQKAQAFSDAIVNSWNMITSVASNVVTNTKTAVDDLVSNFDKGKDNALGITWEPVGENVTKTLKTGLGNTWWTVTGEMVKDMNGLKSTANSYSLTATGMMLVNTLNQGINTNAYQAFKTISDLLWGMFKKKDEVPWITFGDEIPQKVSNGVDNYRQWAINAVTDLAWSMYNKMNGVSFWDIGYNIVADIYNAVVNNTGWLANTLANTAKGLFNIMSGKSATLATSTTTARKTTYSNATKPTKSAKAKSLGGILSNGIWSDIPQFASGTLSAGSLFWAGERGPEIVGHVGGRTEVLNKSQLASAIYSAVQSAMAPAATNFAAAASSMRNPDAGQADYETLLTYIQQGNDATMRQNELLRQQNDYLRSINDKEWTAEVTTSAVQRSLNRSNLRAGTTVVPVG